MTGFRWAVRWIAGRALRASSAPPRARGPALARTRRPAGRAPSCRCCPACPSWTRAPQTGWRSWTPGCGRPAAHSDLIFGKTFIPSSSAREPGSVLPAAAPCHRSGAVIFRYHALGQDALGQDVCVWRIWRRAPCAPAQCGESSPRGQMRAPPRQTLPPGAHAGRPAYPPCRLASFAPQAAALRKGAGAGPGGQFAGGRAGPRAPRLVLQHERDVMACQPRTPWLQLPESARKCLAQAQARAVPTWRSSSSAGAHSRARSSPPAGAPAAQQRSGQARPGRGAYLYCQTCCSCRTRVGAERAPGGRGARTSISTRYRAPQWYARITSTVSCRPATGRLACAARARSTGASQLEGG